MRSTPLYYISPSSIGITPNANGQQNDLAVFMSGAKIRVYCPAIAALGYEDNSFQEWILGGRNRRLNTNGGTYTRPYTIFARLRKIDKTRGYLVFAKQTRINGEVYETHPYVSADGIVPGRLADGTVLSDDPDYWYVRMGEVSAVENGERTVTLDTGILGTDEYNTQWEVIEADMPLHVDIANSKQSGVPSMSWGDTLDLACSLVKGWDKNVSDRVDHWSIERSSGDEDADSAWNADDHGTFAATGEITLAHILHGQDDFNPGRASVFTVKAWGLPDNPEETSVPVVLATGSVTALSEEVPVLHYVDCGPWVDGSAVATPAPGHGIYFAEEKNTETNRWETHDVWHRGFKWRCLQHQPVTENGTQVYNEPKWHSSHWLPIEGDGSLTMEFTSSNGYLFRVGGVQTAIAVHIFFGGIEITDENDVAVKGWKRCSEANWNDGVPAYTDADLNWNARHNTTDTFGYDPKTLQLTSADMPDDWSTRNKAIFVCEAEINDGQQTIIVENQIIS